MSQVYDRSLSLFTLSGGVVDVERLTDDIERSAIVTALDPQGISVDATACDIWFKAVLSVGDEAVLDGLVEAHTGEPLEEPPQQVEVSNHSLEVTAMPPTGLKSNQISQNWCDRTTWWYSSVSVTDETATTVDPERKVWSLAYQNVIDVYHGKITGEAMLATRRVEVVVDSVTKTERDPHYGTGGDFVIDYAAGTVTFAEAVAAVDTPMVSYNYENGSTFIIRPNEGENWKLKGSEAQFSEDVVLTDSMVYEVWAYNPYDLPNKIMVAAPDYYKTIYDFINDANKAYAEIPALGGAGWRGSTKKTSVYAWDFQTTTELVSEYGMELRVRLEHGTPYGGTFATGTFYFIREDA